MIVVTLPALIATEVAASIVFNPAAAVRASSLLITIVHAFSSLPPPGLRKVVKSLTLVPLAIVAVTIPVVSAAIYFALATLKVTELSPVTA